MTKLRIEAERRGDTVTITDIQGDFIDSEEFFRPKVGVHDGKMTVFATYTANPWLAEIETDTCIVPGTQMSVETYEKLCSLVEQCVDAYKGHKESFVFKAAGDIIEVDVTVSGNGYRVNFDIPCVHVGTRLYVSNSGNYMHSYDVIQVEEQSFDLVGACLKTSYVRSGSLFPNKAEFRRWKSAVLSAARETELDQEHMASTEKHRFTHIRCTVEAYGAIVCGDRVFTVKTQFDGDASYTEHMNSYELEEYIAGLSERDKGAQCVDVSRTFE